MGKSKWVIALLAVMSLLIAGCGKTKLPAACEEPTLFIEKDGAVTVFFVGEFDRDYYDLDELKSMAESDIEEFNKHNFLAGDPDAELLNVCETAEGSGIVNVIGRFPNADAYTEYMDEEHLFIGTVGEAFAEGCDDVTLASVKKGEMILSEAKPENKLIITDEQLKVICPGKVAAVSGGAQIVSDDIVDTAGCEGMVYILLK